MTRYLSLNQQGIIYAVKVLTGLLFVWFSLTAFGLEDPYWAVVSLIVTVEPDYTVARKTFHARIVNTLVGSVIAMLALTFVGHGIGALVLATTAATLMVLSFKGYPTNWRLAPITVVILMAAAAKGSTVNEELHLSLLRATEVLYGSATALVFSWIYRRAMLHWTHDKDDDEESAPDRAAP
ncbi:MAG: fusaric acid resistance protein FusB / fusaric acid resistance protein FusC [Rhizobacter sp.]|nr:fusaric acid resistance protein FusB / fusaric acid resistance protein FusC [Rhizobacter sp.]